MSANDKQVGGEHYKAGYQHWDFVVKCELHYLVGCATKYVARWRKKNGRQDLEKSIHYFEKSKEIELQASPKDRTFLIIEAEEFCDSNNLNETEKFIILSCLDDNYEEAIQLVKALLEGTSYSQGIGIRK